MIATLGPGEESVYGTMTLDILEGNVALADGSLDPYYVCTFDEQIKRPSYEMATSDRWVLLQSEFVLCMSAVLTVIEKLWNHLIEISI